MGVIRVTTNDITIDISEDIDRNNLNAGWNTVVSAEDLRVEVHREAVEVAVRAYEKDVADAEVIAVRENLEVPHPGSG